MSPQSPPNRARTETPDLPGLLVDPAWLEERLGEPGIRIVDLRDPDAHAGAKIPGAAYLDLQELGSSVDGCENVLVSADEFGDLMTRLGISEGDTIVAYDDQWGLAAARLAWALHHYGHPEVAVLNGGWDRWQDEGRATVSGEDSHDDETRAHEVDRAPARFEATPQPDVHALPEWIVERIEAGEIVLLDARTPAEFDAGHLPGAISWDWFNAVPDGSWNASRDPDDLRAEWKALGLDPHEEVTVYCRTGMRAAHTWLVLRNAGFERVRLYDGSWQEWSKKGIEAGNEDRGIG